MTQAIRTFNETKTRLIWLVKGGGLSTSKINNLPEATVTHKVMELCF